MTVSAEDAGVTRHRDRAHALIVLAAALAGLGVLVAAAPQYLGGRGFPLDDAWIHMVYARSLAREATLAYNPGTPASGATSPLWALCLALPHLVLSGSSVVIAAKLLGFAFHAATALATLFALPRSVPTLARVLGASFVALHPDLVAASVSGMEVPLTTLLVVLVLATARNGPAWAMIATCFFAPLARPEAVVAIAVVHAGFVACDRSHLRRAARAAGAAAAAVGATSLRNLIATGRPLPDTFYAKFGRGGMSLLDAQRVGFESLLGQLVGLGPWVLLLGVGALGLLWSRRRAGFDRAMHESVAWAVLASIAFLIASFRAVPPIDPRAFYHQRYVLPAVPLLLLSIPALAAGVTPPRLRTIVVGAVGAAAFVLLLVPAPARFARLSNDAHNIDDVQVTLGRALSSVPPTVSVWAVDAGAIRYFGNAFVVDTMRLNSPALLGPGANAHLAEHRPTFVELVPGWSSLELDAMFALRGKGWVARASTPYTVTSNPGMAEHWLAPCASLGHGVLTVLGRRYGFVCAASPP